jgi:hypothetical protein
MKTVMAILLGVTLACSARAYVNTAPATQAQVQAGTDAYHFVTPQTLAGAGVVTNYATWLLLTNKTAYYNGQRYTFSNSTTAGFSEIQAASPLLTNQPSGIKVTLLSGTYPFSTPIQLTNNFIIEGAGMWATGLRYVGPTNLFTAAQVMAALPEYAGQQYGCTAVGLVQLVPVITNLLIGSLSANPLGCNFVFKDFYVQPATNFPCVLISGWCSELYQERVGVFGADVFGYPEGGSTLNVSQYNAHNPLGPNEVISTIGEAVAVGQMWGIKDCLALILGAGYLNIGNSYLNCDSTGAYFVGWWTNGYPTSCWLSQGAGIYSGHNANYGAYVRNYYPYMNGIDMWVDGSYLRLDGAAWQMSGYNLFTSDNAVVLDNDFPGNPINWGELMGGAIVQAGGQYVETNYVAGVYANGTIIETYQNNDLTMTLVNGIGGGAINQNGFVGSGMGITNLYGHAFNLAPGAAPVNGYALRYTNNSLYWAP